MIILLLSSYANSQENNEAQDNKQIIIQYYGNNPNFYMQIKVEVISVPFEGYTNYDGLNRYDTARYGCLQKRYYEKIMKN